MTDEPLPCPSCGALLRLPPGATTVQCPGCQALLELDADDESPPPAAEQPKPAIPLPFGGPPKPAKPLPTPERKVAIPAVRAVKAKLVDDGPADDPYAVRAAPDEAATAAARRRAVQEQLDELDEQEERKLEEFEELTGRCAYARVGMKLLALGSLAGTLAAVSYSLFVISTLTSTPLTIIAGVGGFFLVLHAILTAGGFGACAAGPRATIAPALSGLGVTALHIGLTVGAAVILLKLVSVEGVTYRGTDLRQYVSESLLLSNAFSNLSVLCDIPIYLLTGIPDRPALLALPMVGGMLEFAKLSLMGVLANRFAAEGKDPKLAHDAMRFVYRIFGVVLVALGLKIGAYAFAVLFGGEALQQNGFAISLLMMTNGYFMWWAFACFAQFQTMQDVSEIVTAERFADKRERLEV